MIPTGRMEPIYGSSGVPNPETGEEEEVPRSANARSCSR